MDRIVRMISFFLVVLLLTLASCQGGMKRKKVESFPAALEKDLGVEYRATNTVSSELVCIDHVDYLEFIPIQEIVKSTKIAETGRECFGFIEKKPFYQKNISGKSYCSKSPDFKEVFACDNIDGLFTIKSETHCSSNHGGIKTEQKVEIIQKFNKKNLTLNFTCTYNSKQSQGVKDA